MTTRIRGTFEVRLTPRPADEGAVAGIGRMAIDKQFHGALAATSQGQMLAIRTAVPGSAGYVALEVVTGALDGRAGSFALQHSGTMDRGVPGLVVSVVPDSATGELVGLTGRMAIELVAGEHRYDFTYALPPPA